MTTPRVRSQCDPHLFESWTDSQAWLAGLIWADGCLCDASSYRSRGGRSIHLVSVDEDVIQQASRIAKKTYNSYSQAHRGRQTTHTLRIGNPEVVRRLSALGLTPRKSLTAEFPPIPGQFLPGFMRGYFDGDGSVGLYQNAEPPHPPALHSDIVGSVAFLDSWQTLLGGRTGIVSKKIVPCGRRGVVSHIQYAHGDSVRLAEFMYADDGPRMRRKFDLFESGKSRVMIRNRPAMGIRIPATSNI